MRNKLHFFTIIGFFYIDLEGYPKGFCADFQFSIFYEVEDDWIQLETS